MVYGCDWTSEYPMIFYMRTVFVEYYVVSFENYAEQLALVFSVDRAGARAE